MTTARQFDWEEARRLKAAGVASAEIARRFGVSHTAVRYALMSDQQRRRNKLKAAAYMRARRKRGLFYAYEKDTCVCGNQKETRAATCRACRLAAVGAGSRRVRIAAMRSESSALRARAIELRAAGLTYREIAWTLGISHGRAHAWVTAPHDPLFHFRRRGSRQ